MTPASRNRSTKKRYRRGHVIGEQTEGFSEHRQAMPGTRDVEEVQCDGHGCLVALRSAEGKRRTFETIRMAIKLSRWTVVKRN